MNKCVIIDRDGIINQQNTGEYVFKVDDIEFVPGIFKLLERFSKKDYKIIVITNQACVSKELCTMSDIDYLHGMIKGFFKDSHNIQILAFYVCPHQDSDNCNCRKPKKELFEKAIKDFDIDVTKSYAIGDNDSDLIPAMKIGVKNIWKCETNNLEMLIQNLHPC